MIIIEGVNETGKEFLIQGLSKEYGFGIRRLTDLEGSEDPGTYLKDASKVKLVQDRWHLTSLVYNYIMNRGSQQLTASAMLYIVSQLNANGALVVVVHNSNEPSFRSEVSKKDLAFLETNAIVQANKLFGALANTWIRDSYTKEEYYYSDINFDEAEGPLSDKHVREIYHAWTYRVGRRTVTT